MIPEEASEATRPFASSTRRPIRRSRTCCLSTNWQLSGRRLSGYYSGSTSLRNYVAQHVIKAQSHCQAGEADDDASNIFPTRQYLQSALLEACGVPPTAVRCAAPRSPAAVGEKSTTWLMPAIRRPPDVIGVLRG
jgi:hypothetical protein